MFDAEAETFYLLVNRMSVRRLRVDKALLV